MLTQPSDSTLSIKTVEWLRDNGLRGLVNRVETIYYTLNAPATGGAGAARAAEAARGGGLQPKPWWPRTGASITGRRGSDP